MSNTLKHIVYSIKDAVENAQLDDQKILEAIKELRGIGYKAYDYDKFPVLENTQSFDTSVNESPASLAEALLWKLGKWPTYQTFIRNYETKNLKVSSSGGVVFSAFAKHLQNSEFPIYDQHAIRTIWAICKLDPEQQNACENLLFDNSGNWKSSGSGDDGSCYELFVKHVREVCECGKVSHSSLDKLLMPLGQALKKETRKKKGSTRVESDLKVFEAIIQ